LAYYRPLLLLDADRLNDDKQKGWAIFTSQEGNFCRSGERFTT
jgi:hypothetical protein